MTFYFLEYLGLCMFLLVSLLLVCILFGLATILSQRKTEIEKVVSYECGFELLVLCLYCAYILSFILVFLKVGPCLHWIVGIIFCPWALVINT